MNVSIVFAVLALVPQPRQVRETGGILTVATVCETRDKALPAEGYRLTVSSNGVAIAAADDAGAFYARQTLRQLETTVGGVTVRPCVEIEDSPAYRWRGFLLDDCRHFMGKEAVLELIDLLAQHKMNVLHWHLTEDQGWRIDIPGMPELVKYGSVRPTSPARGSEIVRDTTKKFAYHSTAISHVPYGPYYYTEADLREVVAYAAARHVTIVPEIDMPGHMVAALAAYPHLCCYPEHIKTRMAAGDWGITTDVLCVGNDETLTFLKRVFDYVCDVFPSEVIHVGGDECPFVNWETCPKCQARMKAAGLDKPQQLQGWITTQIADYLAKKGRRIAGWDEILAGDVPKTAIGQSWRTNPKNGSGTELVSGATGAIRGYDMVMTPHDETYYAYVQGLEHDPYLRHVTSTITLQSAYGFDPARNVPAEARKHILGSEACLWTEYIWNCRDLAWRAWPRTCAMAEVLWTAPEPRDYAEFKRRMVKHRLRLLDQGVNCAPLE